MKKIKFMMPALSIASVGAIVTPIVTSCKNNAEVTTSFEYNIVKDKKFVEYTSTVAPAVKKTFETLNEVNNFYMDSIKDNPAIFADDYFTFLSETFKPQKSSLAKEYKDFSIKISNITPHYIVYDKAESYFEYPEKAYFTYSYSYSVEISLVPTAKDGLTGNYTFTYKNIPYYFQSSYNKKWGGEPCTEKIFTERDFTHKKQAVYNEMINYNIPTSLLAGTPSINAHIVEVDKDSKVASNYDIPLNGISTLIWTSDPLRDVLEKEQETEFRSAGFANQLLQMNLPPILTKYFISMQDLQSSYLANIKVKSE